MTIKITAFGALNQDSYAMFEEHLARAGAGIDFVLTSAGPYPNAQAVSEKDRPLRAEALADEAKKQLLFAAVAADAKKAGADDADILCMPCMSMTGFHAGIAQALGREIESLADALSAAYREIDKVGVIHMRPAAARVAEIFGDKAVTPDAAQAAQLLAAETEAKKTGNAAPVEAVMKDIAEQWRGRGIKNILFARADAPLAEKGPAGHVAGVKIRSTFGILAEAVVRKILARKTAPKAILSLLIVALLALSPAPARAQAVPSGAEPSRAGDQIAPLQPRLPAVTPAPAPAEARAAAPEGAEKIVFTLRSLHVDGMTAYAEKDILSFYHDKLGGQMTFADLYDLAARLTAKYRNDGYILSQVVVPEQTIADGNAKLQAVEGFIEQVTVKGGMEDDAGRILAVARRAVKARPLNNRDLERVIFLINDIAGVSAQTVLAASLQTPGAADLTIIAERKPLSLSAETDNRGSRYMGPKQAAGAAQFNDTFGLDEQVTVQAAGSESAEMALGAVTWSQPLDHDGTKIDVGVSVTATKPGYILKPLAVRGVARTLSVTVTHAFVRGRAENLWGYAKLDALDSARDDNLGLGRTLDRVRALRAGGTWQFSDPFSGSNSAHVEISQGLPVLDASRKGGAHLTRPDGDPAFLKGAFEFARAQQVAGPVSLYTAATGQKSADILLASEEFGIGGATYGSAYDSSELAGENGLAARAELRYDSSLLPSAQWYGFYDIGKIWNPDDAVPRHRQASLADAGAGLRFALNAHVSGGVEIAKPLTRPVAATQDRSARFFFILSARN